MSVTAKTTHVAEAKARLLHQFKGKTRLEGLVEASAEQTQAEENALHLLLEDRWLVNAEGLQLDGIGDLVGEERKGKSDAVYRLWLAARIASNLSGGTADEIVSLVGGILEGKNPLTWLERYPAAFDLEIGGALQVDIDELAAIVTQSRAAGVRGILNYSLADDDNTFAFASGDTAEASTTQGFADDSGTTGGFFADAVEA